MWKNRERGRGGVIDSVKGSIAKIASPKAGPKQQIGYEAEEQACRWLQSKGMTLVARNFKVPRGEVDIIGLVKDVLVFIEVRFRSPSQFASAAESVTQSKQNRVIFAAQSFLQNNPKWASKPARFDVVTVSAIQPTQSGSSSDASMTFDWIEDAFQPRAAF